VAQIVRVSFSLDDIDRAIVAAFVTREIVENYLGKPPHKPVNEPRTELKGRAYDPDDETADKRCNRKPGVSESDSEKYLAGSAHYRIPSATESHRLVVLRQITSDGQAGPMQLRIPHQRTR
jgi:hypothetical protein